MKTVKDYVTSIPDFPEPGIIFRDITSVIGDADGLKLAVDQMQEKLDGIEFDVIAGTFSNQREGSCLACLWPTIWANAFIPVSKKGQASREKLSSASL